MTDSNLPADLRLALDEIARLPGLLVTSDYDGTMAPIVSDPQKAFANPASARALCGIAELDDTFGAVVSGRALADLARLSGFPAVVQLVGSHGAEFDSDFSASLPSAATDLLAQVVATLTEVAAGVDGAAVETKLASAALHVRNADPTAGAGAIDDVRVGVATWDGVHVTEGKSVIELAVIPTDKGAALEILRRQHDASAVVFFGDDVTDEKAFARLSPPDVSVKVGDGDTLAAFRVHGTDDVAAALEFLLERRLRHLNPGH